MMDGEKWSRQDGWANDDYASGFGEPDFTAWFGLGACVLGWRGSRAQGVWRQGFKLAFHCLLGVNKYADVIRLSLPRNNVGGALPFSEKFVAAMAELRTVDLESNHIGMPPPPGGGLLQLPSVPSARAAGRLVAARASRRVVA